MPLIIVNSIVCTGLLEYFVDRMIRIIGFAYVVCCFVFYNILFFTFMNTSDNLMDNKGSELRKQIESCTRGMDVLNVPENYSSFFWYQCVIYAFLIFIILDLTLAEVFWFSETMLWPNYSSILLLFYIDFYPVIVMLIIDFTFVFWIRYIKIKFGQLNAVLQSMVRTTIDSPQHARVLRMKDNWEDDFSLSTVYGTYKTNENFVKLKRIKQIHLELMKCARIINEAYGLPILISIFTSILFITTLLYDLYIISMANKHNNVIKKLYVHLSWIFYFCIMTLVKTNICETTITEAIGSITTYLVILIQVGGESEKTKRFKLQIETCIRIMEQLNIPMNLSKCFWQYFYLYKDEI
ncbi:uncharacterized protein LOC124946909 [Vespa velutina]|uniref:uncharacterized protein LOC124946909 n=1 Tax=Vespa velutina TaxID=202808 RepID=UPI001FB52FEC|nr:uncharacterized protein LOC124946909 [Vespa velutina]